MKAAFFGLFFCLCSITFSSAQSSYDSIPRHLVSKIRWMERQGFPASSYQWTEPEINLHLQDALKYRKHSTLYLAGGSGLMLSGVVLTTVGFIGVIVESVFAPIITIGSDYEPDFSRYNTMIIIGGGAMVGGLTLTLTGGRSSRHRAHKEIGEARLKYFSR
ncbi:MAG: hypothetical protein AAF944_17380 [Bacteroidota bacterium]